MKTMGLDDFVEEDDSKDQENKPLHERLSQKKKSRLTNLQECVLKLWANEELDEELISYLEDKTGNDDIEIEEYEDHKDNFDDIISNIADTVQSTNNYVKELILKYGYLFSDEELMEEIKKDQLDNLSKSQLVVLETYRGNEYSDAEVIAKACNKDPRYVKSIINMFGDVFEGTDKLDIPSKDIEEESEEEEDIIINLTEICRVYNNEHETEFTESELISDLLRGLNARGQGRTHRAITKHIIDQLRE